MCAAESYQERLGVQLQLGPVQNVLQSFPAHLPLPIVSTHTEIKKHKHTGTESTCRELLRVNTGVRRDASMSESHPLELLLVIK